VEVEIFGLLVSLLFLAGSMFLLLKSNQQVKTLREKVSQAEAAQWKAEVELATSLKIFEAKKKWIDEAQTNMQDSFKSLASSALEGNNRQFLDLAQTVLAKENQNTRHETEKGRLRFKNLVDPLLKVLETYQNQVHQLGKEQQKTMGSVESEIRKVMESGLRLSQETKALKDALKRPHIRGRWGELQLKNCIELAGCHCRLLSKGV